MKFLNRAPLISLDFSASARVKLKIDSGSRSTKAWKQSLECGRNGNIVA